MSRTPGCCEPFEMVDLSKISMPEIEVTFTWNSQDVISAFTLILLHPLFLLIVSGIENKSHVFSKAFHSRYLPCYMFTFISCLLGLYKHYRIYIAIHSQPAWWVLRRNWILWSGHILVILGVFLIFFSFRALGFLNIFHSSFLESKEQSQKKFPYTILQHPMFIGTVLLHLGYSLSHTSQAGLVLTSVLAFTNLLTTYLERYVAGRESEPNQDEATKKEN